jgi:hypothetical protein
MGVMRLVIPLAFCGVLGLQDLISFTTVYAACCTCGMSCPQGTAPRYTCTCCCCGPSCATDDTDEQNVSYNTVFSNRPLKVRGSSDNTSIIAKQATFDYVPVTIGYGLRRSAMRLDTIPPADLKFQCEHLNRLSEMLSQYQGRY